jgi:hypothetical protein
MMAAANAYLQSLEYLRARRQGVDMNAALNQDAAQTQQAVLERTRAAVTGVIDHVHRSAAAMDAELAHRAAEAARGEAMHRRDVEIQQHGIANARNAQGNGERGLQVRTSEVRTQREQMQMLTAELANLQELLELKRRMPGRTEAFVLEFANRAARKQAGELPPARGGKL